ncbi:unnamed protein product [Bursaphelenchus xylophilus]|uniref:(pine wood nematode) hypothetical protein n=1 Tax=Bursaphelenchus xylophilus TaxID=6326 RepID=A0A1I7RMV1_BURXY|nr:unnamed protein product [Bursaphelenchus xylophilus]CAG9125440.1 unnamed protein product [Bursaphelenchus xylophilus]
MSTDTRNVTTSSANFTAVTRTASNVKKPQWNYRKKFRDENEKSTTKKTPTAAKKDTPTDRTPRGYYYQQPYYYYPTYYEPIYYYPSYQPAYNPFYGGGGGLTTAFCIVCIG